MDKSLFSDSLYAIVSSVSSLQPITSSLPHRCTLSAGRKKDVIKDVILCFRHGSPAYYADCWAPIYTGLHQLPTYRDDPLPSKLRPEGNTEAADQQPLLGRRGEYIHSRLLICVYIKWFIQFSSIQFYSHNPKSQQQSHQGNPTVVQRKSHLEINVIENDKRFF